MMLQGGCNFRARRKLQLLNFLLGNSIDHTSTSLWCACASWRARGVGDQQKRVAVVDADFQSCDLLLLLLWWRLFQCCFEINNQNQERDRHEGEAASFKILSKDELARARRSLEMKLPLPVHGRRPDHARILIIFNKNFCSTLGFILDALCSTSDFLKLDLFNVSSLSHGVRVNHDLLMISHSERSTASTS